MVARLKGNMVRVMHSLPLGSVINANTIVGNKMNHFTANNRRLDVSPRSDEWPVDDYSHETVLRSSGQSLPLVVFNKHMLNNSEGKNLIQLLNKAMQDILDRLFNGVGCSPSTIWDAPIIKSARSSAATTAHLRPPSLIRPVPRRPVSSLPHPSQGSSQPIEQTLTYTAPRTLAEKVPTDAVTEVSCNTLQGDCLICQQALDSRPKCVELNACNHAFHRECIQLAFDFKPQCPVCRASIGPPQGKSPSGTMDVTTSPIQCHGFWTLNSIHITYRIPSGYQLSYHDNPGMRHGEKNANAYLPNNTAGQELLKRLKYSFKHGLTFTVGTSITTGMTNQCTWATIHHKTSTSGGTKSHGYPDPYYIQNCNEDLDALSVPSASLLDDNGDEL